MKVYTYVRVHHVCRNEWIPILGKVLQCSYKIGDAHDPYAVKVMKDDTTVGHLPKEISFTCSLFIIRVLQILV